MTSILTVSTDSEWHSPTKEWLATTFSCSNGKRFFFVTSDIPTSVREELECYCQQEYISLHFVSMADDLCLLKIVLESADAAREYNSVRLLMFYSPKDIEYALGWQLASRLFLNGKVQQKRNISTRQPFTLDVDEHKYSVSVKDMKGWSGVGGLESLAAAVGKPMQNKHEMDEYKSHMRDGLEALPLLFASYSMGDVDELEAIYNAFVNLIRWVQADVIGIPESDCFTGDDIPMTTGALVAATIEKWLYTQVINKDHMKFAQRKLGLLNTSAKDYKFSLAAYIDSCKRYRNMESLDAGLENLEHKEEGKLLKQLLRADFRFLGISQASVNYFASVTSDSAAFSALVQGGRCNNERPSEVICHTGADIDLQSCYGSALREFIYPLGLPTVWAWKPNQHRVTLRQWLTKNEGALVDNLWSVTVSGDLTFAQDLIYSKLVTQQQINKAGVGEWEKTTTDDFRDNDVAHIPGEFALIRRQIRNGIITSDILRVLKAVATDKEIKQLLDLELVTAAAYLSKHQLKTVDEWINAVVTDPGQLYNSDGVHGNSKDSRTRAWVALPMENFIGKLVTERNRFKKENTIEADAKQTALKLFVNTTYGVLASPYFAVGNTVVANNITARARVGAWMMNKALHTRQSITDGGMYSLLTVPVLKDKAKLPGLEILSDNTRWEDARYTRLLQPLAGVDWVNVFENNGSELLQLDTLATQHIKNFWERYRLSLPFAIEHKPKNTFYIASYMNKAHYMLLTLDNKEVYKIRGAREYKETELRKHPTYALLQNLANGCDDFPQPLTYDHKSLLKIGKWKEAMESSGYANIKNLRPGDELIEERTARYNNSHVFCDTVADFERRNGRKTTHRGQTLQWFERYGNEGFSKVHSQMLLDSLAESKNKGNRNAAKSA
ncbi:MULTISPECIES: hypothetical protein [unclassified Nostoc]|uniref:hypothetical protein n=1 Tax=unclassified Nostoc TaxID=2593658 RepID=UPI002AD30968|nr:hypothetical protein [Nostoc sp. DedQUE03]MDZ7974497.1 hypothetical protein [Nostoc sp. DedQUE03]MDZ8047099.1 hypothetical protein [Nostoc sp. DedQUE02]